MSIELTNLKSAYQCAVESHQKFKNHYHSIRGATINFELISGVNWQYEEDEAIRWWEGQLSGDDYYEWEVNFIVYEDDFCIHFDCDDGCGNHHIDVVFLKSEQKRFEDLNED